MALAPMTRSRARSRDLLSTELHAEYCTQRASAGLVLSEGAWVSRDAVGWHDVPGLATDEQVARRRQTTDAVHPAGGVVFAQLWHTGSAPHPDFFSGRQPHLSPGLAPYEPGRSRSRFLLPRRSPGRLPSSQRSSGRRCAHTAAGRLRATVALPCPGAGGRPRPGARPAT
ncbi:hypothetical protein ABZ826_36585 [Streptomyces sp. NPDC047515]|uniref:oxidoreductase n=1 Tax=Streptomyces sp. NPDC047515 TaxID=3155380 RepID=UPI00340F21BF